jgi:hypothetical protein
MGWWTDLWTTKATQWTFARLPGPSAAIPAEGAYVSIFLRSMRIVNVRKGLNRFFGTVHCFTALPHLRNGRAEFHTLTTPAKLAEIDATRVDEIIVGTHRLLGPVPYRGGDVELDLGLFSIESASLAGPFLRVLESLADAAGCAYVNTALPFVRPLIGGIRALSEVDGASTLEVGLSTVLKPLVTGTYVVMRVPQGTVKPEDLRLDGAFQLESRTGSLPEAPYLVFQVSAERTRDDWFQVPELTQAYGQLQHHLASGDQPAAKTSVEIFRRVAMMSPDLLQDDAAELVRKVENRVRIATSRRDVRSSEQAGGLPDLKDIALYA